MKKLLIILLFIPLQLFTQKSEKEVVIEETFLPLISKKDSLHSIKALERDVESILNKSYLNSTDYSIAIYSLDRDEYLYKKNEILPLTPASTTKIMTSFAAMNLFKNNKISTPVYHNGIIRKGILHGDIIIVGKGDPLLTKDDFDSLAVMIKNRGIKLITGNLYVDGSYFDGETSRFKYSRDDDEVQKLPPVSALSVERNNALVSVKAGSKGSYLDVNVYPESETLKYLVYGRSTGSNEKLNEEELEEYNKGLIVPQRYGDKNPDIALNAAPRMRINSSVNDDGEQVFIIRGNLRTGRSRSYKYYLKEPEIAAAGVLKSSLKSIDVPVLGDVKQCELFKGFYHKSFQLAKFDRDLFDILKELNKDSDNYLAENLFKVIGAENKKYNDNYHGARDYTYKLLDSLGIYYNGVTLNDGSGLSRRNLLTTSTLIETLSYIYKQKYYEEFKSCLSVAGSDGTLERRMRNTAAEEILIGKTGTLRNVSALSGITVSLDNEDIAYAFLFNGNNISRYKELENELGELISQFFYFNEEN